ncbi:MAG: aminoacyltransferase [Chloroflexi bacterium]|nr:aminoacyltransferase [Chloroflexota bacterium]
MNWPNSPTPTKTLNGTPSSLPILRAAFLQTTAWAALKNKFNWSSPQRVWLRQDGKLTAGAQILFRAKALGIVKIGYIRIAPWWSGRMTSK